MVMARAEAKGSLRARELIDNSSLQIHLSVTTREVLNSWHRCSASLRRHALS